MNRRSLGPRTIHPSDPADIARAPSSPPLPRRLRSRLRPRRFEPLPRCCITAFAVALAGAFPCVFLPSPALSADADSVLARHVDAGRLGAWRAAASEEERAAFDFLFRWLPAADLAAWRADAIVGDIALALQTRRESPWKDQISDEMWRTWVLPHRVAQEPIQPWRRTLHDLLWPRVRSLSLREAILETNRFCRGFATFTPTSARDQGPLTTLERGLGRCEEETIFFVDAARSVGIPARPAWTPWWMAGDGNHAWVEAWDGTGWHHLGACEPAPELDSAWFTEPARRTGIVLSGAYGEEVGAGPAGDESGRGGDTGTDGGTKRAGASGSDGQPLYKRGDGVSLINSSGVYSTPGVLRIEWSDLASSVTPSSASEATQGAWTTRTAMATGNSANGRDTVRVYVHVYNHGTLTVLADFAAGDSILLGPGDYFVSCAVEGRPAAGFARIRSAARTVLRLDPGAGEEGLRALLAEPWALTIPAAAERPSAAAVGAAVAVEAGATRAEGAAPDATPARAGESVACAVPALSAERLRAWEDSLNAARRSSAHADSLRRAERFRALAARDSTDAERILDHLLEVPPRTELWLAFALDSPAAEWPTAAAFLLEMDDKDLVEADTTSARAWIRECSRVRQERAQAGYVLPDSIWESFVLSPRIDRQPYDPEPVTALPAAMERGAWPSPRDLHARLAGRVKRAAPTRLGHVATPSQTWASGWATPASARVGLVGWMRRNGVAARVEAGRRWVEAWSDGRWVPCDPLDPQSWDRRGEEVVRAYEAPSRLHATFFEDDSLLASAEPGRHFLLARFRKGHFEPDYDSDYPVRDGVLEMDLEPGTWWLFAGMREADGSPRFLARVWDAGSGGRTEMKVDLGSRALATARDAGAAPGGPGDAGATAVAAAAVGRVTGAVETTTKDRESASRTTAAPGSSGCTGSLWIDAVRRAGARWLPDGRPLLLYMWDEAGEPSRRVTDALRGSLKSERLRVGSIVLQASDPRRARAAEPLHPLASTDLPGIVIESSEVERLFARDPRPDLPYILLLDSEGGPLLCLSGLRLDAPDAIRRVLREVSAGGEARERR